MPQAPRRVAHVALADAESAVGRRARHGVWLTGQAAQTILMTDPALMTASEVVEEHPPRRFVSISSYVSPTPRTDHDHPPRRFVSPILVRVVLVVVLV